MAEPTQRLPSRTEILEFIHDLQQHIVARPEGYFPTPAAAEYGLSMIDRIEVFVRHGPDCLHNADNYGAYLVERGFGSSSFCVWPEQNGPYNPPEHRQLFSALSRFWSEYLKKRDTDTTEAERRSN